MRIKSGGEFKLVLSSTSIETEVKNVYLRADFATRKASVAIEAPKKGADACKQANAGERVARPLNNLCDKKRIHAL